MKKYLKFVFLTSLLGALSSFVLAQGAELVWENNEITGVHNLELDGKLWDVTFIDGTCAENFSGCEDRKYLPFYEGNEEFWTYQRNAGARAANALAAYFQQFIGKGIIQPVTIIRGCDQATNVNFKRCIPMIPVVANADARSVAVGTVFMYDSTSGDLAGAVNGGLASWSIDRDFSTLGYNEAPRTWAKWQEASPEPQVPEYSCVGFQSPANRGAIKVKNKRSIPFKAEIKDIDGVALDNSSFITPPRIVVLYQPDTNSPSEDVSDLALPTGMGTEGQYFEWNIIGLVWQYNLNTENYTQPGFYNVYLKEGDDSEYIVNPECLAQFEIK